MLKLLPEPKRVREFDGCTKEFGNMAFDFDQRLDSEKGEYLEIAAMRFRNRKNLRISAGGGSKDSMTVFVVPSLEGIWADDEDLFLKQGYSLKIEQDRIVLKFQKKAGFVNAATTLKQLLTEKSDGFALPLCEITDWPTVEHRAVAPTFSWYAGYGRIGFDMQLWGYDEWMEYLNVCLDDKLNQMNMVMYGYWPFGLEEYPETVFRDVPIKIWNRENRKWLTVRYTHPNIERPFLADFIALAHRFDFSIFAYVGLNSYNGAYSIKHPEKRMVKPAGSGFMNDFDSVCLSDEENIRYILASMRGIAQLGFDGFTLEESEEGFWFCNCDRCEERWGRGSNSPVDAKHKANMWLLDKIYREVREVNPDAVIGIRAFRQPPLEKDPGFLRECVENMPKDIALFWAPALYVSPSEFKKWIAAFGRDRIWGRDTEANAITSTMGRLFRIFESNMIRYKDEPNVQVIERDIEQHITSAREGVSGINGFMFEWYGLFMFQRAHGNYGWGSTMDRDKFFELSCEIAFGAELGRRVLVVLKNILTIHESQMPLYTTPFPFQKNKITVADIPEIMRAKLRHPGLLDEIHDIQREIERRPDLAHYIPHFAKIENAERRNAAIYDMMLASLRYQDALSTEEKERCLDEILFHNEKDFDLVKEMFFDINPVCETGVKSCMYPYHEIKRIIHNIRYPESPDDAIICSGIEALGWLWL
ncbi:MAG TPA: glycoside hydrolase family 20 zincin-like fold domain-containing protein [Rectinemataceae bacterium]|nr:glycoside hydrolase family 20 zincin-like fold domain-containing protein [Rectinemataceae bacterium]